MADTTNRNLLKDDWQATAFLAPIASWMNKVSKMINGLHVSRGGQVEIDADMIRFRIDEFPWRDELFGCTIFDNSHIRVEAGLYVLPTGNLTIPTADVEVTGDPTKAIPHFIPLTWDPMGDVATLPTIGTNAVALEPESDTKAHRVWLCEVYFENAKLQIGRRGHHGPLPLGGIMVYDSSA